MALILVTKSRDGKGNTGVNRKRQHSGGEEETVIPEARKDPGDFKHATFMECMNCGQTFKGEALKHFYRICTQAYPDDRACSFLICPYCNSRIGFRGKNKACKVVALVGMEARLRDVAGIREYWQLPSPQDMHNDY